MDKYQRVGDVELNDTATWNNKKVVILAKNKKDERLYVAYSDSLEGEIVKLWVDFCEVETW